MRRPSADLLLLSTVTIWALNFPVSKYILDHGFHPLAYSAVRYTIAALLFAAITLAWERSLAVGRTDLVLVGGCVVVLFVNQVCFVYALHFTTATTTALLFGTLPIFTALLARLLGIERLGRRVWAGAAVSVAGVALVTAGSGGALSADLKGDALALLGTLTWAAYSVAIAPLMRRYSPFRLSSVVLLAVSVVLLVVGSDQTRDQDYALGTLVWVGFAYAVIGPLVVTNVMWFTAIDRVGPSRASVYVNLQPFLAAVLALVLLSEDITALQVAGGAAIALGIVLARRAAPVPAAE